jgi:uncharacterized protein DUF3987
VSLHLMVQPGVATLMLGDADLTEQGLLSRCLVIAPESHSGQRFYRDPAPETKNKLMAYERWLGDILQRPLPLAANSRNVLAPRVLQPSTEAAKVWRTFVDNVEMQLGPGGAVEPINGFANKLPEHAARLAAVLTLVEEPAALEITPDLMARGIVLAKQADPAATSPQHRITDIDRPPCENK